MQSDLGPIWLFGASSIIGYALARQGGERVVPMANPFTRAEPCRAWPRIDLADPLALRAMLAERQAPALVVYAHAVCTVSKCEAEPAWARRVNVAPVDQLTSALPAWTRFVYVSSDHVFGEDGVYRERDEPCPISVYGQTRIEAEQHAMRRPGSLVVRPGLAIGPSVDGRTGHRDWLAYRYRQGLPISIIQDEARSAVSVDELAARVWALSLSDRTGLYHLPATRPVDRPELARRLMAHQGLPPRFRIETRAQQPHPHLGRVTLASIHDDPLAARLPAVTEALPSAPAITPSDPRRRPALR